MKNKQKKRYLHNFKLAKKFATTAALAVTALGVAQPVFTALNTTVVQADDSQTETGRQVTKRQEKIPFSSRTVENPDWESGRKEITQQGEEGIREFTTTTIPAIESVLGKATGTATFTTKAPTTTTTTTETKPTTLVQIYDFSSSYRYKLPEAILQGKMLIEKALTNNDSKVIIQAYTMNFEDSYTMNSTGNPAYSSLVLSKSEALTILDKLYTISQQSPSNGGFGGDFGKYFNEIFKSFGVKAYALPKPGEKKPLEDVVKEITKPSDTISVIQFTDGWDDGNIGALVKEQAEAIDESYANWAKGVKTFMTVVNRNVTKASDGTTDKDTNSNKAIDDMKRLGHPNIYDSTGKDKATVDAELLKQFMETAVEKVSTSKGADQTVNINIGGSGIMVTKATLVHSDKTTDLPIKDGSVSFSQALPDGSYTVNYEVTGNGDFAAMISVDGKEVQNKSGKVTSTPGQAGSESTTEAIVKEPIEEVITIGTKGSDIETKTEKIPFETKYQDDDTLEAGQEKVLTEGVEGEKTITTTYVTQKGERTGDPVVEEKVTKEKVDKVIARGTKGSDIETKTEKIPFETKYQDDDTLEAGQEKVLTEGIEGEKTITTTYVTQKGERTGDPVVEGKVTKEKVNKVIARGTKGSDVETKTEKIPFETKYQDDPTLPKGQEKVLTEGVEGEKTITSTYTTQKGERVGDPVVEEKVTKEKVDKVIARGTQEVKTVSYKVVDATDKTKELVKLTKVSEGYTGDKYKIDLPKLEGYTVKAPENVKLEGEIADKDIVVEFLAEPVKKVGKDVILKFEDTNGKKIAEDKVIAHEKEIGTDFEDKAPETLKVGDQTYQFVSYKDNVKEVKGKVTEQEQVFTAIYSAPKQQGVLPSTGTTVSVGLSILGFIGLAAGGATYFWKKKGDAEGKSE